MRVGSRWKFLRRLLRYWLDHSERQRSLWAEMEFHIESMTQELAAQRHVRAGSARRGAQEVWQYDTKIRRSPLHLDRALVERPDAGFTALVSRHATRCRIHGVYNSHRRPRYRSQYDGLQCGQCAAAAPAPISRSRTAVWITNGDDFTTTQAEHYSDLRELNQSFSDLAGWSGYYRVGDKELTGTGEPERVTSVPVTGNFFGLLGVHPAIEDRSPPRSARGGISLRPPSS